MSERNPFQVLSKETKYENPWIKVTEHQVINPKGKPGIYGVVSFKNRAIGVIPYEDGHVWMVGQYRFPLSLYSWEIPEGGSPAGEDPMETAKRELREETGLEAERLELILTMHLSNSVTDEIGHIYLATGLKQGESDPEDTEELQTRKIPLKEVYSRIEKGEITDSLTVAGILRLMLLESCATQPAGP